VAEFLGRALSRPSDTIGSFASLRDWLTRHDVEILLVVAPSSLMTADALAGASQAIAEKSRRQWGVLTAQDAAGVTFAAAKLLAMRRAPDGADGLLDAIYHRASTLPGDGPFEAGRVARLVADDWRMLLILAHGEGAHANLESIVLCGLPGELERNRSGKVVPGCEALRTCKRVNDASVKVRRVVELRSRFVAFLTCGGFSVAGEQYPSDGSLILAAAEGFPAAVLTTPRLIGFSRETPLLLHSLLQAGCSLGEVTSFMNELHALRGEGHGYVLHGDPAVSLGPRVQAIDDTSVGPRGEFVLTPRPVVRLGLAGRAVGRAVELEIGGQPGDGLHMGTERAVILNPELRAGVARLVDRGEELDRYQDALRVLVRRAAFGAAVERAIEGHCAAALSARPRLREHLDSLANARRDVETWIWDGLRVAAVTRRRRTWDSSLEPRRRSLLRRIAAWDQKLARLLSELCVGNLIPLLHHGHTADDEVAAQPCPRCGSTTLRVTYRALDPSLFDRVALECRVCGPLCDHSEGSRMVTVNLRGGLVGGETAVLDVAFAGGERVESPGSGILVGEVRDKGKGAAIHQIYLEELLATERTGIPFHVPADTRFDMHTAELAWVCGMDVSYARCRFPRIR
jgi:hypothetical protein